MRIATQYSLPGIARTLRERSTHSRKVGFGWLRRDGARYGGFWATSGDDARALFEEFATIQQYIRGDEGNFLKSLLLARTFSGSELGNPSRTGLLLDVLEANQLVRNHKIEAAVEAYVRRIQQEEQRYRAMLRGRQRSDARRELSEQRGVLGLLELNLAELLGRESSHFGEAERRYQQACAYMPGSTYAYRCYAEFLVSQKRWEQAIDKYRQAYVQKELDDTGRELNASLAWVYLEWSQWLNRLAEPASEPEAGDSAVSSPRRQGFMAFWRRFSRVAGKAARVGIPSPPSSAHSSMSHGPFAALGRLDLALRTLKWEDIPSWEASFHFRRASILDSEMMAETAKDVADAFLKSAQRYSAARDPTNSALAFDRAGDVLVKRGLVKEAIAVYENGLKQAEAIDVKDDWSKQEKRRILDPLLSKLAISWLGVGDQHAAILQFERLRKQWWGDGGENIRLGGKDWGPFYDIQFLGKPLLALADLRHSLTTYYHWLLANAPSFKDAQYLRDARDITSALFDLYRLPSQGSEGRTEDAEVLGSAPEFGDLMNVVTPLAIEMGEDLATVMENEDDAIRKSSTFELDDIKDLPSLASKLKYPQSPLDRYLVDRLSSEAQAALARYESHVSDPIPLQTALLQLLDQIVAESSIYDAQRFADIALRPETEQLLAKNPHGEDLRRLNALLLEAAYPGELSRNAVGRYAGPMRRRIEAKFGVRVPGVRVRSLPELERNEYRLLIDELVVAEGTCNEQRLEQVFLHLETVIAANLVDFIGHQETQNYLERHKLVVPTVEDISEKEHCSHIDPLAAVLRALVSERVPLTEPNAIYEVFRSGWKQGLSTATIVERVRRIPKVQARLWGNDGKHAYVLLSSSLERLLAGATRAADQSNYLVLKERERTRILATIGTAIAGLERPALIARRQEQRALVRQLVAARYPDVPVLSTAELRSSAERITEMSELD